MYSKNNKNNIDWNDPTAWELTDLPGVGPALAVEIVKALDHKDELSPTQIKSLIIRNPYILMEAKGLGWKKVDTNGLECFEVSNEDPRRHQAGNQSILEREASLRENAYKSERAKLNLYDTQHEALGVVVEDEGRGKRYWLERELQAEKGLRDFAIRHVALSSVGTSKAHLMNVDGLGSIYGVLDATQRGAVESALTEPMLLLTGGAGCGKTAVIAALCKGVSLMGRTARVMAFAGKAADRARQALQATGIEVSKGAPPTKGQLERGEPRIERAGTPVSTIHRALGFRGNYFSLERLEEDYIIVDESSMLPNWLLWAIVERMKPAARLILVGDDGQLPPIGYGFPFSDFITLGLPRVHLSKNYRQADVQGILELAQGIRGSKRVSFDERCVETHLGTEESELKTTLQSLISRHGGLELDKWQVITWKNSDVQRFNLWIQAQINPRGEDLLEVPMWDMPRPEGQKRPIMGEIRVGDKVLVTQNNTELDIFNGQLGTALGIIYLKTSGFEMPYLQIAIESRRINVPLELAEKYVSLGYCITVHKAQGSDWERCLIVQPSSIKSDLAQRWFYTAVTRAKNVLVLVSQKRASMWWAEVKTPAPTLISSLIRRCRAEQDDEAAD